MSRGYVIVTCAAALLCACTATDANGLHPGPRRTARILLTATQATQAAILVYGRLPDCARVSGHVPCRQPETWVRLREADRLTAAAIAAAAPVLAGDTADNGELDAVIAALAALRDVLAASASQPAGRAGP